MACVICVESVSVFMKVCSDKKPTASAKDAELLYLLAPSDADQGIDKRTSST